MWSIAGIKEPTVTKRCHLSFGRPLSVDWTAGLPQARWGRVSSSEFTDTLLLTRLIFRLHSSSSSSSTIPATLMSVCPFFSSGPLNDKEIDRTPTRLSHKVPPKAYSYFRSDLLLHLALSHWRSIRFGTGDRRRCQVLDFPWLFLSSSVRWLPLLSGNRWLVGNAASRWQSLARRQRCQFLC